jgi:FkbM family methyltransferase
LITTSSPVIFDVGANVGQSIDLFRYMFPDAKLFLFEPGEIAFTALREKYENKGRSIHENGSLLNSILPMDTNPTNRFVGYKEQKSLRLE